MGFNAPEWITQQAKEAQAPRQPDESFGAFALRTLGDPTLNLLPTTVIKFLDPTAASVGRQTLRMLPRTVSDFLRRHPRTVEVGTFPAEQMAETGGVAGALGSVPGSTTEPLFVDVMREGLDPSLLGEELLHASDFLHNPRKSLGAAIAKTSAGQGFIKAMMKQGYSAKDAIWEIFGAPARAWSADPAIREPALALLHDPEVGKILNQAYELLGRSIPVAP